MSQQEVRQLFAAPLTLKKYCVIGLLCGSGLRISEVAALCIPDIGSAAKRIKVVQGKGAKDRYTYWPILKTPGGSLEILQIPLSPGVAEQRIAKSPDP